MNELTLFEELRAQDNIWDAQTVGKNIFCKNPNNKEIFVSYFDFCIKVASYPIESETRSFFIKEAELALSVFSEKAEMSRETLLLIDSKRHALVEVSHSLNAKRDEDTRTEEEAIRKQNNTLISNLVTLKGKFLTCSTQSSFDNLIAEMSKIENELVKDAFSEPQRLQYESLTKDFSELVSKCMGDIADQADTEYNRKAVQSFKEGFDLFKKNTSTYTGNDSKLYELVANYLFAFEARRLFNESMIYYNHVYTYIFNKLDDEGKFRFTQFSFDIPKFKN